jgi:hypothetical protein
MCGGNGVALRGRPLRGIARFRCEHGWHRATHGRPLCTTLPLGASKWGLDRGGLRAPLCAAQPAVLCRRGSAADNTATGACTERTGGDRSTTHARGRRGCAHTERAGCSRRSHSARRRSARGAYDLRLSARAARGAGVGAAGRYSARNASSSASSSASDASGAASRGARTNAGRRSASKASNASSASSSASSYSSTSSNASSASSGGGGGGSR